MGGVVQLARKVATGRVGFRVEETMSGHHRFVDGRGTPGQHPIEFTVEWGPTSLLSWLNPLSRDFLSHPLRGTVSVGGLCDEAAVDGYMELRYLSEHKIRYAFDFEVDGTPYHFFGEKSNIRLHNIHRTHTTLNGTITDQRTQKTVSEAELYFYWSTLPSMLLSFRLQ